MEMVVGEKSHPNFLFINQTCLSKTFPGAFWQAGFPHKSPAGDDSNGCGISVPVPGAAPHCPCEHGLGSGPQLALLTWMSTAQSQGCQGLPARGTDWLLCTPPRTGLSPLQSWQS